jgi:hypothetical protein
MQSKHPPNSTNTKLSIFAQRFHHGEPERRSMMLAVGFQDSVEAVARAS